MKNRYELYPQALENIVGSNISLSITLESPSLEVGSKSYFEKYGYSVITGLDFKNKNNQEQFEYIFIFLVTMLNVKIEKKDSYDVIFTSKNIDVSLPEEDFTFCRVLDSNLKKVIVYIETKNGEYHCVELDENACIFYNKDVKLKRYGPNLNIVHRFISKIIPSQIYFYKSFFNFKMI